MADSAQSLAGPRIRAWLVAMVFAALAPIAAWTVWQTYAEVHALHERASGELQRAATDFSLSVNRELSSSLDALTVLSQSEIFQQGRIAAMGRLLHGRPRRDWDSIFLLDPQGAAVLDTAQRPGPPEMLRELHAAAIRRLTPVVSGAGKVPGIAIAMPIMQGDHARYVLGVRVSDSVWPRLAANASLPEGGQARLFDAQGHLISQSGELATDRIRTGWETVPVSGWRVRIAVPAAPIEAQQRHLIVHALSTSGAALLAGLVLAALLGRVITRRLSR
ncbi:MAG TPA: hypothetical protein VMZ74_06800 [Ramlibacter sp.]|nr:hypothetical protein [Ramlibacter sp.]